MTASFDPKLIADVLVNLFGALGTLVVAYNLRRSDPHGPVTLRAMYALDLVAALFLMRSVAWSTGSGVLLSVVGILAAFIPLTALLVAEGLLRRHAPRWLKLAIVLGGGAAALFSLLPGVPALVGNLVELAVVGGGFAAIGVLLWTRDRASLTEGENSSIRRMVIALALLVPLIVTDFPSIVPDLPMRFGAVGALVVLFFAFGPARDTNRQRMLSLLIFAAIAGLFAFGYLSANHGHDAGQAIRTMAVGMCGLMLAALCSEVVGAQSERRRPADPLLTACTPEQFAAALREHRLIGSALILGEDDVAPLRHAAFDALIAERPILKRAEAPWGRAVRDDGVERAMSLFMTYDATHIMRLSQQPPRLAIFALPQISADARAESDIAAAQRIGELIFTRTVTS
jgi:hypothetical protein